MDGVEVITFERDVKHVLHDVTQRLSGCTEHIPAKKLVRGDLPIGRFIFDLVAKKGWNSDSKLLFQGLRFSAVQRVFV